MPNIKKPATFLAEVDFPLTPLTCFVIARKGRQPISQEELALRTGWSMAKVQKFCRLKTWRRVTVEDLDKWRLACGIPRSQERRHRWFLKTSLALDRTPNGLQAFRKRPANAQAVAARGVEE